MHYGTRHDLSIVNFIVLLAESCLYALCPLLISLLTNVNLRSISKLLGSKIWRAFILFLAGAGAGITATASTYPFDIM